MAPLINLLKNQKRDFDVKVCVTGQHQEMLYQVLNFFSIKPDFDLRVMKPNQTLFSISADIISKLEPILGEVNPDIILVQGDTTSAFIGALAGYYKQIKVGHLEAGLRSGDMYSPFPEEINRKLISNIANWHFAPTLRAKRSLLSEGVNEESIAVVGNTVIDALLLGLDIIHHEQGDIYKKKFEFVDFSKKVILCTGHRRESFGGGFDEMCEAIKDIAQKNSRDVEIVYPVHLNPNVQEPVHRILGGVRNIHLIDPLDYPSLIWLMSKSYIVLTDSGGIQEEAPALGKPVLVMRNVTERQEGIEAGVAKLVGTDRKTIVSEAQQLIESRESYDMMSNSSNPYGDGTTSAQIIEILKI